MLDKETAINTVKKYSDIVMKEFTPVAVIMFGSYLNGTPTENSDIDVAVVFDNFTDNWHEVATRLWRLRRDISLDIEPHLLDISEDRSGFVNHVYKTGQIIYQAPVY
ncbi:MAG: nucleotidyltransferase domain-containing protein [Oscillospiraceae bacterium]|nr:nucleotidyltransferase domain-containing protein [Oscillospiraceae bacterium]